MKENRPAYTLLLLLVTGISIGYFKNVFEILNPSSRSRTIFIGITCVYLIATFPRSYEYRPVKVFKDDREELLHLQREQALHK